MQDPSRAGMPELAPRNADVDLPDHSKQHRQDDVERDKAVTADKLAQDESLDPARHLGSPKARCSEPRDDLPLGDLAQDIGQTENASADKLESLARSFCTEGEHTMAYPSWACVANSRPRAARPTSNGVKNVAATPRPERPTIENKNM